MRRVLVRVVGLALAASACTFGVNVDEQPFSCRDDADCGEGWACVARAQGTSVCHPVGACVAETCNGRDDDCDGLTDEGFDLAFDEADCGACGTVCPEGTACLDAACAEDLCDDGVDNDGDGPTDCADADCEGVTCGEGCLCSGGVAVETACGDGVDNDRDGRTDETGSCL